MLIGARQDCVAGGADIPAKLAILKALGYDFLELSLTREEVAGVSATSAAPYRDAVARTGLPILSTSMGHFGEFAALAPRERATIAGQIRALIAFTHALGADLILLATWEANQDVAAYAPVYREALLPLAEEAARVGVTLALEHVAPYTPFLLAELVRALDHPALRVYFDMGNCLNVGENPLEQARLCAPLTAQFHVKPGPTTPLAAMPLVQIREILAAGGFQGRACLEIVGQAGERPLLEARGLLKMAGYC